SRGKKVAFGDGRKILWGPFCAEVYENNPNVARPGQERLPNIEWEHFHIGSRGYSTLNLARNQWIWNYKHRMRAGEFFVSAHEKNIANGFRPGFIVIEPNLPWWKPVAVNKDWGEAKYRQLGEQLIAREHRVIQFRHHNMRRVISGVEVVDLPRF